MRKSREQENQVKKIKKFKQFVEDKGQGYFQMTANSEYQSHHLLKQRPHPDRVFRIQDNRTLTTLPRTYINSISAPSVLESAQGFSFMTVLEPRI